MAAFSGFSEDQYEMVFIILDKMDKIGLEGVEAELEKEGFSKENIEKYLGLFREMDSSPEGILILSEKLKGYLEPAITENLASIIRTVEKVKTADFRMFFDPTLVRGMSYYTGPIFEIAMDEYGGSVGGGGRYDEMIGKFTGQDTSACGFSIGFERIVMLLLERGFEIPSTGGKKAFLIEKNMPSEKLEEIFRKAAEERKNGNAVSMLPERYPLPIPLTAASFSTGRSS